MAEELFVFRLCTIFGVHAAHMGTQSRTGACRAIGYLGNNLEVAAVPTPVSRGSLTYVNTVLRDTEFGFERGQNRLT